MSKFRFQPCSLFLSVDEPIDDQAREKYTDDSEFTLSQGIWLSKYLHERIHWIQSFSTFGGLQQSLVHEYQRWLIETTIVKFEDNLLVNFPLRSKVEEHPPIDLWNCLEVFSAVMNGGRSLDHLRHNYGQRDWAEMAKVGCQFFSQCTSALRENQFIPPSFDSVSQQDFISPHKLEVVYDPSRRTLGASSVLELQAELGEVTKLTHFSNEYAGVNVAFDYQLKQDVSILRDAFYNLSGVTERTWRSDLICMEIAYYALNSQAPLFVSIVDQIANISNVSTFNHFCRMCQSLRPFADFIDALDADCPDNCLEAARPIMDEAFGENCLQVILDTLESWCGISSGSSFLDEGHQKSYIETCYRGRFIRKQVETMVDIGRREPLFLIHPGLLYVHDRKRFSQIYQRVCHVVECRFDSGFTPSPLFCKAGTLNEYATCVSFGVALDLFRTMAIRSFEDAKSSITYMSKVRPEFRDIHFEAVKRGIECLLLPGDLEKELKDAFSSSCSV